MVGGLVRVNEVANYKKVIEYVIVKLLVLAIKLQI
ncbi:hypothetical protein BH09BAC3_BH09BAC3_29640 [soil metagenome]